MVQGVDPHLANIGVGVSDVANLRRHFSGYIDAFSTDEKSSFVVIKEEREVEAVLCKPTFRVLELIALKLNHKIKQGTEINMDLLRFLDIEIQPNIIYSKDDMELYFERAKLPDLDPRAYMGITNESGLCAVLVPEQVGRELVKDFTATNYS